MAVAYNNFQSLQPKAKKEDLLAATLRSRYCYAELDAATVARLVSDSNGSLAKLVLTVAMMEIPTALTSAARDPNIYLEMVEVINEAIAQYAPSAS